MNIGEVTMAPALSEGESKPLSTKAVDDFLAYMKKSLAERMADAWLAAHGLDRQKLKAMKPAERDAVLKQMAAELAQQLRQATADKSTGDMAERKNAAA
jgi:hypothetical protein